MQILSYLFKKPQTGDKGSVFFPALEQNFQQLNDHTHNGTNSAKLPGSSVTSVTQAVSSAGWLATSGGTYRQIVTLPGTMLFDDHAIIFRNQASPKKQLFLDVEKISSNTYYAYTNDNTVSVTAYYLS